MGGLLQSATRTRVAGRMAVLFFLCAGIPLATLSILTIFTTTTELDANATVRLRYEARSVTQEILGRLNTIAQGLNLVGRDAGTAHAAEATQEALAAHFAVVPPAIAIRPGDGPPTDLLGDIRWPELSADRLTHLADWGRTIVPDPNDSTRLLMIVGSGEPGATLAAAQLDERQLLGLDESDFLPPDSVLCAQIGRRRPICSDDSAAEPVGEVLSRVGFGVALVDAPTGAASAWVTDLSLDAHYATDSWKLALLRPRSVIREPISGFVRNLLLAVLLASLLVGLVSVQQVRRQLRPLEALLAGTTRLGAQDFEQPVDVTSGDEFQMLGEAFNSMAGQLRNQFRELEAFNIGTLTTLARTIDAKSHWTGGHSERVTADAVQIGRAMALPANELDELKKGGLVHDVGKIATPPEILDKPARLTPEEEAIMRLHPEQGVHILEPIAAFRALLPIVGQHHEKWDGTGYPARLAGTAIARTARVLAVADVYDALRSDRPYRAGLPHTRCVAIIREGAGTHFDPAVVEAFLRVERAIDLARPSPSTPAAA